MDADRRDRRQDARRREILAAARRRLAREGPERFSIAAVAAEAGLSKPSVFYYFPDKAELVGVLAADLIDEESVALLVAVEAAPDGVAALEAMLRAKVALYAEDAERFAAAFLWPLIFGIPPRLFAERIYPAGNRVNDRLEVRLAVERAAGRIHPDVDLRRAINVAWLQANGILGFVQSLRRLGGESRFATAQLLDEACGIVRRGVLAP
jgi:AcrR family transcriptional regulator